MPLPKQVQNQVLELDELEKQLYGNAEPADPDKPVAKVVAPEAQQTPDAPTPEPATEPESEPAKDQDEAKVWKQKYKTLQGMYDADVPRLHQQVKELTASLEQLKASISEKDKQAEQAQEEAKYERLKNLVTDEDRQEFGDELIEVQRKVAREETAELYKQLEAVKVENAKLRESLERTGSQVTQSSFEQRLISLVPDFNQVNVSPAWIKWLDERDPLLRAPRRVVAEKAYAEGDAEGVAHFVKLFKDALKQAEPEKKAVTQELESQIQPSKSTSSPTTPSPKGAIYTNDQVRQMFVKVTQLNKMGKLDEARKLEAEIDSAYMQGRVVG